MWIPSCSWRSGPRLYSCKETREVYMCCVDFMKGYNCVPLGGLWEVLQEYGVIGARDTNHPVIA